MGLRLTLGLIHWDLRFVKHRDHGFALWYAISLTDVLLTEQDHTASVKLQSSHPRGEHMRPHKPLYVTRGCELVC